MAQTNSEQLTKLNNEIKEKRIAFHLLLAKAFQVKESQIKKFGTFHEIESELAQEKLDEMESELKDLFSQQKVLSEKK